LSNRIFRTNRFRFNSDWFWRRLRPNAKRDIGREILLGLREIERVQHRRVVKSSSVGSICEKTGLSQERFATLLGVSESRNHGLNLLTQSTAAEHYPVHHPNWTSRFSVYGCERIAVGVTARLDLQAVSTLLPFLNDCVRVPLVIDLAHSLEVHSFRHLGSRNRIQ